MRIRSIRPEFWSSEDVSAMTWDTRLIFIGLWSYVDDNGVGRDVERLIVAALFPLDEDFPEASRRVTGALRHLSDHGQITRYTVDSKAYLHITAWSKHQRIEKASKGRYPAPTCENAEIAEPSPTTPVALPEMSTPGEGEKGRRGEGEKGRRGEGEKGLPCSTEVERPSLEQDFDSFWECYPRRVAKGQALKAYKQARKKTEAGTILQAVMKYPFERERPQFIPYPATWLNGERWGDENVTNSAGEPAQPVGRWDAGRLYG